MLFRSDEMHSLVEPVQAIITEELGLSSEESERQAQELEESMSEHALKDLK